MGRKLTAHPLYTIVFLSFLFFVVFPVLYTIGAALFTDGNLGTNLQQINKSTFLLLAKSSVIAFLVAAISTTAGTLAGFLLYRTNVIFRQWFKIALLVPLFISPYILAVAWKDLFYYLFGNTAFLSSHTGVILVLTTIYTPLAMLITGSALANINGQLEESGFMFTGTRRVIFRITLPLIKPAVLSSFALVFIFSISDFSVPAFFGVKVFTTEIFTQFSAFYNHSLAVLQSAMLVTICILLLFSERKYLADAPFLSVGVKGTGSRLYNMKNRNILGMLFLSGWFFISVVLPFIVLFLQAFEGGTDKIIQAWSLLKPTFGNSAALALAGASVIVFTGFTAAYFSDRNGKKLFNMLLLFIFAVPSTILGISLIKFYNQPWLDIIYSGYAIIIIGYTGKFTFIASRLIGNAIEQIPASLNEAALMEGVNPFGRLFKITIPLILPVLWVTFIISFIFCFGELGTTIMLYPPGTEIMPIKVFTIMANAPQSLTSSMTLIVFAVTLLIITGMYFIIKPVFKRVYLQQ